MVIYALSLGQAMSTTTTTSENPAVVMMTEYTGCLRRESLALEVSDSDFNDIFLAAKTACASEWMDLYEAGIEEYEGREDFAGNVSSESYDFTQRVAEGAKDEIRLDFFRTRAARKTQ